MQRARHSTGLRRLPRATGVASLRAVGAMTRPVIVMSGLLVLLAALMAQPSRAATEADHSAHHHYLASGISRTIVDYRVPRVTLVRDDGKSVLLTDELDDGRPVVLSFIYTTCTTICPLTSATLSDLQRKLGEDRGHVHLVSISIDPEQDTPARLREYAQRFSAGPEWNHYTGTVASSAAVQRAFGAYAGDKMSHRPVTLVRAARDGQWVRLDGFATSEQMLAELQHGSPAQ